MRIACFSSKSHDRESLTAANGRGDAAAHALAFIETALGPATAALAVGFTAVCLFVNDVADRRTLERLAAGGTLAIALRCSGFNNVDLAAAAALGIVVVRVPAYSPHAVAEHTVGLMLMLNRRLHRAYNRVREGNFALEGLLGFDMRGKTVGVVGTGRIGAVVCRILAGFGCVLIAHDPVTDPAVAALGVRYAGLDELLATSDIVTLHAPLTPATRHLIAAPQAALLKPGMMLINTSRGALIDTPAVIAALKRGTIGALGLDVYEEEAGLFFQDRSSSLLQDDVFARLLTFPNVVITGHQAFFTAEAVAEIAITTLANLSCVERGAVCANAVRPA